MNKNDTISYRPCHSGDTGTQTSCFWFLMFEFICKININKLIHWLRLLFSSVIAMDRKDGKTPKLRPVINRLQEREAGDSVFVSICSDSLDACCKCVPFVTSGIHMLPVCHWHLVRHLARRCYAVWVRDTLHRPASWLARLIGDVALIGRS